MTDQDPFFRGFYKTAKLYKNLASAAINSIKKTTKIPSALKASAKNIPKPKSDVLDYGKLRAEMSSKNIANRSTIKRRLSGISGSPVLTSKNRMY